MTRLAGSDAALTHVSALALLACVFVSGIAIGATPAAAPANVRTIKLATWNLEWLIAPSAFKELKASCAPKGTPVRGDTRRVPCDVATRFERSSRDFSVLARYARELDADVVALQEVDGADAARLVFPDYQFCFTTRRHVQNTGFAVRRGIPHRCGSDVRTLSLGDSLRRGAELTLFPGEAGEMRLLSVHLKSGCSTKALSASDKPCRELARQAPELEAWIDAQARARRRFAVLGDFNRDLLSDAARKASAQGGGLWAALDDADPPEADLHNAAAGEVFRKCVPGQAYRTYIDYIVLSRTLAGEGIPGSFSRVTFSAADARHARLSDHCPIAIRLRIEQKP
jgi:endonuclease/exonuclease/phosphatase family metal-dependent hydrolase